MCIRICYNINSCEKRRVCDSNSKSMVLRIFHVCVLCIEFVSQVGKHKNAHVSFPVGMVTEENRSWQTTGFHMCGNRTSGCICTNIRLHTIKNAPHTNRDSNIYRRKPTSVCVHPHFTKHDHWCQEGRMAQEVRCSSS